MEKMAEIIVKRMLGIFSAIVFILYAGNPPAFQPAVTTAPVTTETTQITVEAKNDTWFTVGDPRVRAIEKSENGQWVKVGEYTSFTEEYGVFYPLSVYAEKIKFSNMNIDKTLPAGEYRVVISYNFKGETDLITYAYFSVIEL